jgi:RNA-directed DNA polymerase
LQDLRRSLYVKAKAEPTWRFWGLYVHVCKMETLCAAFERAKSNNGAPGIDGVAFEAIEESGAENFLKQIRDELMAQTYRPMRARRKEIPKDNGKVRGPGSLGTHTGTNFRGRLPRRVVWLPTEADSS